MNIDQDEDYDQKVNSFVISSICFPKHFACRPHELALPLEQAKSFAPPTSDDDEDVAMEDETPKVVELDWEKNVKVFEPKNDDEEVMDEAASVEELSKDDIQIVAAYNAEDFSMLRNYVFQPQVPHVYPYQDGLLSNHCLAVEWMNYHPYHPNLLESNIVATATFDSHIELWDMDAKNLNTPIYSIGNEDKPIKGQHKAGILSLSWNQQNRTLLASASEDRTAKIWDIPTSTCQVTFSHHKDIVHGVKWCPLNYTRLLTSSFDNFAYIIDPRDNGKPVKFSYFKKSEQKFQPEDVAWMYTNENQFATCFSNGLVKFFDTRNTNSVLNQFIAHKDECHSIAFHPQCPHLLATCGTDKYLRLWNINKVGSNGNPKIFEKQTENGLFVVALHQNLAVVGGVNEIQILRLQHLSSLQQEFPGVFTQDQQSDEMEEEDLERFITVFDG